MRFNKTFEERLEHFEKNVVDVADMPTPEEKHLRRDKTPEERLALAGKRRTRRNIGLVLSGMIVFCTVYYLILPALTIDKNKADQMAGMTVGTVSDALISDSDDNAMNEIDLWGDDDELDGAGIGAAAGYVDYANEDHVSAQTTVYGTNIPVTVGLGTDTGLTLDQIGNELFDDDDDMETLTEGDAFEDDEDGDGLIDDGSFDDEIGMDLDAELNSDPDLDMDSDFASDFDSDTDTYTNSDIDNSNNSDNNNSSVSSVAGTDAIETGVIGSFFAEQEEAENDGDNADVNDTVDTVGLGGIAGGIIEEVGADAKTENQEEILTKVEKETQPEEMQSGTPAETQAEVQMDAENHTASHAEEDTEKLTEGSEDVPAESLESVCESENETEYESVPATEEESEQESRTETDEEAESLTEGYETYAEEDSEMATEEDIEDLTEGLEDTYESAKEEETEDLTEGLEDIYEAATEEETEDLTEGLEDIYESVTEAETEVHTVEMSAVTESGIIVNVSFSSDTFDTPVDLAVKDVPVNEEAVAYLQEQLAEELAESGKEIVATMTVDVSFIDSNDEEIEPQNGNVIVSLTLPYAETEGDDYANASDSDSISEEPMDEATGGEISKENEESQIYVIHTREEEPSLWNAFLGEQSHQEHDVVIEKSLASSSLSEEGAELIFALESFSELTVAIVSKNETYTEKGDLANFLGALIWCNDGDRAIKLTADLTITAQDIINYKNNNAAFTRDNNGYIDISNDKGGTVSIDLNGHSLTFNGGAYLNVKENVTLNIFSSQDSASAVVSYTDSDGSIKSINEGAGISGDGQSPIIQVQGNGNVGLENVIFHDIKGRVISAENGNVKAHHTYFINNGSESVETGAIRGGALELDSCTFVGNHTSKQGGAICLYGSKSTIISGESLFLGNGAGENGGAIHLENGTLTISGATFANNISKGSGGAIFSWKGEVKIDTAKDSSVLFSHNFAQNGGAIHISSTDLPIKGDVTFSGNTANANGGAIYAGGNLSIEKGVFAENEANASGGAIDARGSILSIGSENGDNKSIRFENNISHQQGGAIQMGYNGYQTFNLYCGTFKNNQVIAKGYNDGNAYFGGGAIRTNTKTTLTIYDGLFDGNSTDVGGGGAIKVGHYEGGDENKLIVKKGSFTNNSSHGEGGAISLGAQSYGLIKADENAEIIFARNRMTGGDDWGGGALFCADGGTLQLVDSEIYNNHADGYGGGIAGCSTGRVLINEEGTAFFNNSASGVNLSSSSNLKSEDRIYTAGDRIFHENDDYQDYFCALQSKVFDKMLGGGSEKLTGSADSEHVYSSTETGHEFVTANHVMGLTAHPDAASISAADKAASVKIYDNYANTHGGGVLCNGFMIFGKDLPTEMTLPNRIMISATKLVQDAEENTKPHTPFLFHLYDCDVNQIDSAPIWSIDDPVGDNSDLGVAYTVIDYNDITGGNYNYNVPHAYYFAEDQDYRSGQFDNSKVVYYIELSFQKYNGNYRAINEMGQFVVIPYQTVYIQVSKVVKGFFDNNGGSVVFRTDTAVNTFKDGLTNQFIEFEKKKTNRYQNINQYAPGDYYYEDQHENHASTLYLYPVMYVSGGAIRRTDVNDNESHSVIGKTSASFINKEKNEPFAEISFSKVLNGKSLSNAEFQFEITGISNAPMPMGLDIHPVLENISGSQTRIVIKGTKLSSPMDFNNVTPSFTLIDNETKETFSCEAKYSSTGWSFAFEDITKGMRNDIGDTHTFILRENGRGTQSEEIQYDVNDYTITVTQKKQNADYVQSEATITATPAFDKAYITNDYTGSVKSWPIKYTKEGTYEYIIKEYVPEQPSGFVYDNSEKKVTVVVDNDGNGNLRVVSVNYAKKDANANDFVTDNERKFVNQYSLDLDLVKIDETSLSGSTVQYLFGAEFELHKGNGTGGDTLIAKGVTVADGTAAGHVIEWTKDGSPIDLKTAAFADVSKSDVFRLVETKAPDGYSRGSDILFSVDPDTSKVTFKSLNNNVPNTVTATFDKANGLIVIKYADVPGVRLPETGGQGTHIFYLVGALLILTAGGLLVYRTDKREREAA